MMLQVHSSPLCVIVTSNKGGNVGKFLRMALKGAVAKSFEASRAAVRVMAVNQGDFRFKKVRGRSVVDGGGVVLGTAKDHERPQNDNNGTADVETLGRTLYTESHIPREWRAGS